MKPVRKCVRAGVSGALPVAWLWLLCLATFDATVAAQTIDDGIMLSKHTLLVGDVYSHDAWDEYWEGTLKRDNGNIGTVTSRANVWFANYGVTDRLNVIASVPHVWTHPSAGVLQSMQGFQDLMLSAKYNLFHRPATRIGALRGIAVATGGFPLTDYTPDFFPLSIGSGSTRLSGRFTLDLTSSRGWFTTGSTAYTWRAGVQLDRPYYYTDDEFFLTDQVDLPNVADYVVSAGYARRRFMTAFSFSQQQTLGGGDIRRQDMPFVSNQMNFTRIGGMALVSVPKVERLGVHVGYAQTVAGRNVGQASTVTVGLQYRLPFGVGGRQ
jgi:hypothetical protein